jgi:hypothetical protein
MGGPGGPGVWPVCGSGSAGLRRRTGLVAGWGGSTNGQKMVQIGPPMVKKWSKSAHQWSKDGQKMVKTWSKSAHQWSTNGPPKSVQHCLKKWSKWPTNGQNGPNRPTNGQKKVKKGPWPAGEGGALWSFDRLVMGGQMVKQNGHTSGPTKWSKKWSNMKKRKKVKQMVTQMAVKWSRNHAVVFERVRPHGCFQARPLGCFSARLTTRLFFQACLTTRLYFKRV